MSRATRRASGVAILLAILLFGSATGAGLVEDARGFDVARLEGKMLRPANPDDVLLLGVVSRGVLYKAQKGEKLTAEQLRLVMPVRQAFQAKKYDDAYRYVTRLLLSRQGVELGEGSELATSLDFRLDRKLLAPGEPLTVLVDPYRVHVPKDYKPGKEYPVILALHGAIGDENTYMDRYSLAVP